MGRVLIPSFTVEAGRIDKRFEQDMVKNEPMLFNCSTMAAFEKGGPITKAFLAHLPEEWDGVPLVIDSRVHMLMPGWYPCIPGWHHDDVPRVRSDGQPEYEATTDRADHIIMLVNAEIAPTEFAIGEQSFEVPPLGKTIYEVWHREVEACVEEGALKLEKAESNVLYQFTDRTWHRGVPAVANGWRFFIRASRYYNQGGDPIARRNPRTNEVRKQVQVYMSAENAGW